MRVVALAFFIVVVACRNEQNPRLRHYEEILADKPAFKVVHRYPQLTSYYPDSLRMGINTALRSTTDVDRYLESCTNKQKPTQIISDYRVLLNNDSILSLEFKLTRKSAGGVARVTYFPIVLPADTFRLEFYEDVEKHLHRQKLWPYVQQLSLEQGKSFNHEAYKKGSRYHINFAFSEDSLILYPGGEGEFHGFYRLPIPLKKVYY